MCGILGQIAYEGYCSEIPQLKAIKHRGPDGRGEWTNREGNVYLGHTRLAILDPTEFGQQPMQDSSKRYTIIFNGEIYNHLDLRLLLPDLKWKSSSDTETLIELYAVKGLMALPLLKGMFAFAVYDSIEDSILLVRDRLGIKPLWFSHDTRCFSFSSEARPILRKESCSPTSQALNEFIGFGRMPASGEIFDEVYIVPAGNWLKIERDRKLTIERWWPDSKFTYGNGQSREKCAHRVRSLVTKAVEEHLISDVGIGTFLSGGIDSSIITLIAGKALGKNLKSFTIGYPQSNFDERATARKVASLAGTEHHEIEVNETTCLDWVMGAVASMDLPSVDAINTYIVSKAVRETGLKVALSGLGGDELFGGYPSFKSIPVLNNIGRLPDILRNQLVGFMPQSIKDKLHGLHTFDTISLALNRRRFTSIIDLAALGFSEGIPSIPPPPSGLDTMGLISWAELHGYTIPMLLRDSDQMSMAVGLEIRVPFLDHCLVEEVLGMAQRYKKGKKVKPLLIDAFKTELPPEVYNKPKQGFVLPMDEWMRGALKEFTEDGIAAAVDLLSLPEPKLQYKSFQKRMSHWTRCWLWCILGHWLAKRTLPEETALVY
ncbi:asparagine synthase (glutamine-hydrolyzing) [Pontibacter virosus]|uniref:asparagine synthase (glutamine-hydrolyzing) n=1 Tax=Pontibacter virosus TaxID=1765052 RepID=A0A2U1AQR6_9BACT|nr:asparagine synthase (glutamine-hydrolyzing) [Pontibacter virosus]PVY38671.1 asparagine synthase (glutamine-hydrolysing) [Pontibacter virosus]